MFAADSQAGRDQPDGEDTTLVRWRAGGLVPWKRARPVVTKASHGTRGQEWTAQAKIDGREGASRASGKWEARCREQGWQRER